MTRHVHLHPDGSVLVHTSEGTYCATPEQFAEDFGESFPALPPGAAECFYDQGRRHMLNDHNNRLMVEHPMPVPWPEGDRILERAEELLRKHQARLQKQTEEATARMTPQIPNGVTR